MKPNETTNNTANNPPGSAPTAQDWKDTGARFRALVSPDGTPCLSGVTLRALPAGVEIIGNGTLSHPLDVKLSGCYADAPQLAAALTASEVARTTAEIQRGALADALRAILAETTRTRPCLSGVEGKTLAVHACAPDLRAFIKNTATMALADIGQAPTPKGPPAFVFEMTSDSEPQPVPVPWTIKLCESMTEAQAIAATENAANTDPVAFWTTSKEHPLTGESAEDFKRNREAAANDESEAAR